MRVNSFGGSSIYFGNLAMVLLCPIFGGFDGLKGLSWSNLFTGVSENTRAGIGLSSP
jgi:hypothetical protein